MEYFLQIAVDTIVLASLYTLIGAGFSLRYSIVKYLDIGYAVYMAVGAYAYLVLSKNFGLYAVIYAVLFSAIVAYFCERFYFAKLEARKSSPMIMMIASLGFMILLQAIIAMIFTSNVQGLRTDISVFNIFGIAITDVKVASVLCTFTFVVLLNFILKKTKFGAHIRAINDNKILAETAGIPVKKISLVVAAISAGIATLAGILYGMDTSIVPLMGMSLLLSGVTAAIITDIHDAKKVYVGGLILATIQNAVMWYIGGEWKDAVVFLLLIIILLIRPEGIIGKKLIRTV
jgi:branched-chain amino acid transport system permease protein